MKSQTSFSELEYDGRKRLTRRDRFLSQMEQQVPWQEWLDLLEPVYPKGERGRPPIGCEKMLRLYLLQVWYELSAERTVDAVYDSHALRRFSGIDLAQESVPDATTLLKFRHLLEANQLPEKLMDELNQHLSRQGLRLCAGTIVDASLCRAAHSSKNEDRERNPKNHLHHQCD